MTTRMRIKLNAEDRNALQKRAEEELRDMPQQALQLLREGMAKKDDKHQDDEGKVVKQTVSTAMELE